MGLAAISSHPQAGELAGTWPQFRNPDYMTITLSYMHDVAGASYYYLTSYLDTFDNPKTQTLNLVENCGFVERDGVLFIFAFFIFLLIVGREKKSVTLKQTTVLPNLARRYTRKAQHHPERP